MKKIVNKSSIDDFELLPEYRFDYSKAKPNRFAKRSSKRIVVTLDPDVAKVFQTEHSVNKALGAFLTILPKAINFKQ